jgi:hypothetical protein
MSSFAAVDIEVLARVGARKKLEDSLAKLQEVNSSFPATREFLKIKGCNSVAELDREEMRELQEFLRGIYRRMVH